MNATEPRGSPTAEAAILAFAFLSLASVGLGLIITAWLAAGVGSVRLVGQLFFIGSATSLVFGFVGGMIVDRCSRSFVVRLGLSVRLLGAAVLVIGVSLDDAPIAALAAFAVCAAAGMAMSAGAVDGIVQSAVPEMRRVDVAVRVALARQLGLAAGTGLGGLVLDAYAPSVLAAVILVALLGQVALSEVAFRPFSRAPEVRYAGMRVFWKEGVAAIVSRRELTVTVAMIALLYSVAQMTNVLVPGFVRDVLSRGSDVYGLLEAAWSIGGGAILMAAALPRRFASRGSTEFLLLGAIGLLMIGFASMRLLPALVASYATLGACFALCRAICEGRILTLAPKAEIGRVRSISMMTTSIVGLAVYASPTITGSSDPVLFYVVHGGAVALASVGLYVASRQATGRTRSCEPPALPTEASREARHENGT